MAYQGPRLRPLGVGDLLDEIIRLYRNHFVLLAGVVAVVMVPVYVVLDAVQLVVGNDGRAVPGFSTAMILGLGGFTFLWVLLSLVAYMAVVLALTWAVSEIYLGRRPTIASAYSGGLQRLGGAIGMALLIGVAMTIMVVTIIGIPVATYFGICWVLSLQVLLLERRGITASMGRSRALVRGYWWRTLGILILLGILGWVVSFVFGLPSMILAGVGALMHSGFISTLVQVVGMIFSIAGTVLVTPIQFCGAVLLYYDLRVRKEGFDLELMAREMGSAAEAGPSVG